MSRQICVLSIASFSFFYGAKSDPDPSQDLEMAKTPPYTVPKNGDIYRIMPCQGYIPIFDNTLLNIIHSDIEIRTNGVIFRANVFYITNIQIMENTRPIPEYVLEFVAKVNAYRDPSMLTVPLDPKIHEYIQKVILYNENKPKSDCA
jgi:hypothetical protein